MRSALIVLICGVLTGFVSACQTDVYQRGRGPIILSQHVLTGYEKYKLENSPTYFAVANDGRGYGFTNCPHTSCVDDNGDLARELCNRSANIRGSECSIFAVMREIIWSGEITYSERSSDFLFLFAKTHGGDSRNYSGTGHLVDSGRKVDLRLRNSPCWGEANLATKKWFLKGCKNNYSASGTFVAGTGVEKYYGIGRGNTGGSVEMKLLDPKPPAGAKTYDVAQHPTLPTSVSEVALAKYKAIDRGKFTHKAFAASEGGAYGYASNRANTYGAVISAFMSCNKHSTV